MVKTNVKAASVSEALRLDSGTRVVPGIITAVSQVYHMIKKIHVKCSICGYSDGYDCKPPINYLEYRLRRLKSCPTKDCEGFLYSTPKNIPAITIEIRNPDSSNDLEVIKAVLFGKNIKDVIVGENVVILGEIVVTESRDKGYSVIYAKKMKYEGKEEIHLSLDDTLKIEKFAESKSKDQIVKELVSMVAPSVIGHQDQKEGILLSAVMTPEDKPRRKTRLHILFLGPPGVAKTELLHGAADPVPGSSVQSGQGSTGLSLTALVVKEEDTTVLRIGPIPRARGRVCCINEINKQNYADQDKILDFMQEGQSNINKFGHSAPIRGPTTIIASANPVHGDFTKLNDGKIDVNEVTIMAALRDRFDLTYVFESENDHDKLLKYADEKGRLLNQDEVPVCEPFIVKYIMHAKIYDPNLSEDAMSILNKCYADLASTNSVSPRRLETLYNLAITRAKLKLKEIVDIDDATETVEFYNKVIEDYHKCIAVAENPRDVAASKIQELLEQYSKNVLTAGPITFIDLIKNVCENDLQVKLYIGDDLSMRSNYKLRPIAQLIESNPRVKRTKSKPLTLQWVPLPVQAAT